MTLAQATTLANLKATPAFVTWRAQNQNYAPVEPVRQMIGIEPNIGVQTYYRIDANGTVIDRYETDVLGQNAWKNFKTDGPFDKPFSLLPALMPSDQTAITRWMFESGLFTASTPYIVVGDEPVPPSGASVGIYMGQVNLQTQMSSDQYSSLLTYLTYLPRMYLRQWFDTSIVPSLPIDPLTQEPQYEDMMWGAFIDVFNKANSTYVQANSFQPWDWENQKTQAFMTAQNASSVTDVQTQLDQFSTSDPQSTDLMAQYADLPPIGDPGLEINRQNAVKQLLLQGEYETVQAIIDAYRYANTSPLSQAVTSPIPFNVTTSDGSVALKTPSA